MAAKKKVKSSSPTVETITRNHNIKTAEKDISIMKLVNYNLLFFIPVLLAVAILFKIGVRTSSYFAASPMVIARVLLIPVIFGIFYFIVPFIRRRENIDGVRYSIMGFLIIAVGISLPSAIQSKDYSMFFNMFIYVACYILLTFFFCPEVLGMEKSMRDWFQHNKQLNVVAIYISIVFFFILGFGGLYYDIHMDSTNAITEDGAFLFSHDENPSMMTFIYFSMVSYTTTGYGEILPISPIARVAFFMEALLGLVMNVLFIAILLMFISNAEFLGQQEEDMIEENVVEDTKRVLKEEKELIKEEKKLKKEEREVRNIEKEIKAVGKKAPIGARIKAFFDK